MKIANTQLKPFDNPGEVLLKGLLWPFPQPSKLGASLTVGARSKAGL
jgi:hypothetical protein